MTDLSVPWGQKPLEFSLPEDWELVQTANSTLRAAPEDWPDRLAMALNQPEAGLPLSRLLAARRGTRFNVTAFKEWTGVSRKYAIPLLEYLDRERMTRREGNERVIL